MIIPYLATLLMIIILSQYSQRSESRPFSPILEACRLSPYKDLCISAFSRDPKSHVASLHELAVEALHHASTIAKNNTVHLKQLLKNPDLEPMAEQCLTDCSEQYIDATSQIGDSMAALLASAYSDVEIWVNAAIVDADSCAIGLAWWEPPERSGDVRARNDHFRQVCRNAIGVTQVLAFSGKGM